MRNATREEIVQEFHEAFGHPVGTRLPDPGELENTGQLLRLRLRLLREELGELIEACESEPAVNILKELADLQYVLSGFAVTFGLPLNEAFLRVHESNMSKLGEDGKPIYRKDGKVLKGPNYREPDLSDLV